MKGEIKIEPTIVPVQVLQEGVATLAVEGAVGPTDLEQGANGPSRTGPAIGARTRYRWQRQATRARRFASLRHFSTLFLSLPIIYLFYAPTPL